MLTITQLDENDETQSKMNGKITEHISSLPNHERNHIIDIIN